MTGHSNSLHIGVAFRRGVQALRIGVTYRRHI